MNASRHAHYEALLWAWLGTHPTECKLPLTRSGEAVRVQQVGEGDPVLFIHGASNSGSSWAPLVPHLPGFRCLLLDRPGCGLSPPLGEPLPDMTALAAFADDLIPTVLDGLGLAAAAVVGTSYGGYFALRAAAAHPGRVTRLVLLGWSFGAPIKSAPLAMRIAMQPFLGRLITKVPMSQRMTRSLLKQIGLRRAVNSGRFGDVELRWFQSLLRDTDTVRNEIDSTPRAMTMKGFNDDTLLPPALLASIRAPTCLLWGDEDPMGDAVIAAEFAAQIPGATLEIMSDAGHAPWIDNPEYVADRLVRFLRAESR